MRDLFLESLFIIIPYFLVFSFLLTAPYLLGMGLWKLGVRGRADNLKDLNKGLQLIACSIVMFFLIFRILIWSWQW